MNAWYIDPTHDWSLFVEMDAGFFETNTKDTPNYAAVLYAVKKIFEDIYSPEYVNRRSPLSVLYTRQIPQTFRENHLIFLQAQSPHYQQVTYQFAHELFHHMLPHSVVSPYRWLEESLAELSSQTALHLISSNPERYAPKCYVPFLGSTPRYIASAQNKATKHNLSTAEFISSNRALFEANPYVRENNCVVANALFDLFNNRPELWRAMLYLPSFSSAASLRENLERIQCKVPESSESILEMISILCG